jgi:hypothetical protein
MDSTRAELEGVLGAMRGLWMLWEGGVIHRLHRSKKNKHITTLKIYSE